MADIDLLIQKLQIHHILSSESSQIDLFRQLLIEATPEESISPTQQEPTEGVIPDTHAFESAIQWRGYASGLEHFLIGEGHSELNSLASEVTRTDPPTDDEIRSAIYGLLPLALTDVLPVVLTDGTDGGSIG